MVMNKTNRIDQTNCEKVNIDGVELSYCTVADSMSYVKTLFSMAGFHAIGEIGMTALEEMNRDKRVYESLISLDYAMIGDTGILAAAGLDSAHQRLKVENLHFCKELMYYMEENGKKVFVLGADDPFVKETVFYFRKRYPHLVIAGAVAHLPDSRSEEEDDDEAESIVNEINSSGSDLILSVLPEPEQEIFLYRYHNKISARMWYSLGDERFEEKSTITDQLRNGLRVRQLRKRMGL